MGLPRDHGRLRGRPARVRRLPGPSRRAYARAAACGHPDGGGPVVSVSGDSSAVAVVRGPARCPRISWADAEVAAVARDRARGMSARRQPPGPGPDQPRPGSGPAREPAAQPGGPAHARHGGTHLASDGRAHEPPDAAMEPRHPAQRWRAAPATSAARPEPRPYGPVSSPCLTHGSCPASRRGRSTARGCGGSSKGCGPSFPAGSLRCTGSPRTNGSRLPARPAARHEPVYWSRLGGPDASSCWPPGAPRPGQYRRRRCDESPPYSVGSRTTRQRKPGLRFLPQQEGGI